MRTLIATVLALVAVPASAAVVVAVKPYPGAAVTKVFGINDANDIAGSWTDVKGVEHGFEGSLNNTYASFDFTANGAIGTQARSVNNAEDIVGWAALAKGGTFRRGIAFEHEPFGMFTEITAPQSSKILLDGIAQGIGDQGQFTGDYLTSAGGSVRSVGYLGSGGRMLAPLRAPFGARDFAGRGVDSKGNVVGFYSAADGRTHGLLLQDGVASTIDVPGAVNTWLEAVNDQGQVVGQWDTGLNSAPRSFLLDIASRRFTRIDVSGSAWQQAFGINNAGVVALNTDKGPYVWCADVKDCTGFGQTSTVDAPPVTEAAVFSGQAAPPTGTSLP